MAIRSARAFATGSRVEPVLVEGIKSRPVYATLTPRPGGPHLIAANEEGALAVIDLAAAGGAAFLADAPDPVRAGRIGRSRARRRGCATLGAAACREFPANRGAIAALREDLRDARMGTQVYAAGTEDFIAQVVQAALEAGSELGAIGAEHRGSLERRVQCVHCKAITQRVTTQPVTCSGCGLSLLVRDHYSRRIGAFQGVSIDAEEPGTAPPPDPVFA